MVFKASILLLCVFSLLGFSARADLSEADLNEAVQKKNWPEVVLLITPEQGQNFDHDVTLVRAYLFLERRSEALALASKLYSTHKDEKTKNLLDLAGTIFFSQDTSNLYYEAIRLISISKFQEAHDRLDQALVKEPNQVLVLTRLVQVELVLGLKDAASTHLKAAQADAPFSIILKLFAAKLAQTLEEKTPDVSEKDSLKEEESRDEYLELLPLKSALLEGEVTALLWFEMLQRTNRAAELLVFSRKILKEHPTWTSALLWFYKNGKLNVIEQSQMKAQIDKNLKNKDQFNATLEKEMKQTQYGWVGYIVYENLLNHLK